MALEPHAPHYRDPTRPDAKDPTYWAMQTALKCAGEMEVRRSQYYEWLNTCGRRTLMRRAWIFYNMAAVLSGAIVQAGDKGQYAMLYINEYRRLLNRLFQVIIGNRPAWQPKAMSKDSKALAECRLARTTLDYYMRAMGLDKIFYRGVEYAGVLGEGFVEVTWDAKAGKPIKETNEDGSINNDWFKMATRSGWKGDDATKPKDLYQGDLAFETYSGIDVIRDPNAANYEECDWILTRKFVNKYNLGARYPEKKTEIERLGDMSANVPQEQYRNYFKLPYKSDRVVLYTLWHKKTPACPEGRELRFLTTDIILEDKPLGYSKIPSFRISGGEMDGTSNGYTVAFDLSGPQEMINNCNSSIATLIKAYAIFSVIIPVGTRVSEARLPEGLNLIPMVGATKPEPINFLEIKAELFNYLKLVLERMEEMTGATKPNPNASGSAQAIQASEAQQFNQFFQSSYESAFEDVGTMAMEIMKEYATAPRMIEIVGDDNKATQKMISKDSFSTITRVVADVSDPMSKTAQGRFNKAQLYVQAGQADNEELFNILDNGSLIGEDVGETQEITIQAENEALRLGQSFSVYPTDDDTEHLRLHGNALADIVSTPESRQKASQPGTEEFIAVNAFTAHIQLHQNQMNGQPPQPGAPPTFAGLKQAMGQKPGGQQAAAPGATPPGGGSPSGPAPGEAPPTGAPGVPTKKPDQSPGRPSGGAPDLPDMPGGKTQYIPGTPPPPTGG